MRMNVHALGRLKQSMSSEYTSRLGKLEQEHVVWQQLRVPAEHEALLSYMAGRRCPGRQGACTCLHIVSCMLLGACVVWRGSGQEDGCDCMSALVPVAARVLLCTPLSSVDIGV